MSYIFKVNGMQLEVERPDGSVRTIDPADFYVGMQSGVLNLIQKKTYVTVNGIQDDPIDGGTFSYTSVDWASCELDGGDAPPTPYPTDNRTAVTYLNTHYFKRVQYSALTL